MERGEGEGGGWDDEAEETSSGVASQQQHRHRHNRFQKEFSPDETLYSVGTRFYQFFYQCIRSLKTINNKRLFF